MSLLHRSSWTGYLLVVLIWNWSDGNIHSCTTLYLYPCDKGPFYCSPSDGIDLLWLRTVSPIETYATLLGNQTARGIVLSKRRAIFEALQLYCSNLSLCTKTNMSSAVVLWCYVLNIQSMMTMRLNLCPPPRNHKVNHIPDCTLFQVGLDFTFCYCYIVQHARAVWLRRYPFKKRMFSAGISSVSVWEEWFYCISLMQFSVHTNGRMWFPLL